MGSGCHRKSLRFRAVSKAGWETKLASRSRSTQPPRGLLTPLLPVRDRLRVGCAQARDRRSGEIYRGVWGRALQSIASRDWKKHPRERRVALCPPLGWQLALRHVDRTRSPHQLPLHFPLVGVIPAKLPAYDVGQVLQSDLLCDPCRDMSTTMRAAVRPPSTPADSVRVILSKAPLEPMRCAGRAAARESAGRRRT